MANDIIGRAFLVGSPRRGLQCTEHDVQRMAELLYKRGFKIDTCCGTMATRDGILAGYDRLIAGARESNRNAPAVFYYSGHGFVGFEDKESASWRGIAPMDLDESTEADFRGITSWELSVKQAQLAESTKNVTVILDCCFASLMSRDAAFHQAEPKAVPPARGAVPGA